MNKTPKNIVSIICIIIILAIICILTITINKVNNNKLNNNISGDTLNSGERNTEEQSGELEDNVHYELELTSGENEIVIIAKTSGEITTTKYIFENDTLKNIVVSEEIMSGDIPQNRLASIINDSNVNEIYENFELNGNTITMNAKQEYVDVFSGFTKEQLYEKQEQAFNESKKTD